MAGQTEFEDEQRQIRQLNVDEFDRGTITRCWVHLINNGIGEPIRIPILVARGVHDGPIFGLTAALHGNELNGIPVIQRLMADLDTSQLCGTVVGVMVANVPAFLEERRKFTDGVDLNHVAPGKPDGDCSKLYMYRLIDRIVNQFDYLIDLHTASFGRVNSYYIRADMSCPVTARISRLFHPDIILDNPPNDYTLRGHASLNGAKSITLELRDPHKFQFDVIKDCVGGINNVLIDLKMLPGEIQPGDEQYTIVCDSSFWIYTNEGGILSILPKLGDTINKGDTIAQVKSIFGTVRKTIPAPENGIVIGKSVNPVNQTGSRVLHLGRHPQRKLFPKL